MPSWFWGNLLLLRNLLLGAIILFTYTTATGFGGYCLHNSIRMIFAHKWKDCWGRGAYALIIGLGLLGLMIILPAHVNKLQYWEALIAFPLPYVLGFFGWFLVPGEWGEDD